MYKRLSIQKAIVPSSSIHLSFLYQTGTILGLPQTANQSSGPRLRKHYSWSAHKKKTSTTVTSGENDTRPEGPSTGGGEKAPKKTFLSTKAESVQKKAVKTSPKQSSTITRVEKETFSKIFRDLVRRGSKESTNTESLAPEKRKKRLEAAQDALEAEALSEKVASIYQDAIREYGQVKKAQPGSQGSTLGDKLLARLPLELRKSAIRADSLYSKKREVPVKRTSSPETSPHEFVRPDFVGEKNEGKAQRHKDTIPLGDLVQKIGLKELEETAFRFDQAIKDPSGDLVIWQICEERIFPLILLVQSLADQDSTKKTPIRPDLSSTKPPSLKLPSYVPPLTLVSRLYPASLNLALSLLANHFPTSLILPSFLPRIKSLGPISFVLGASTTLYNTLLKVRWRIYSDLRGMNDLLTDMSDSGVDFDETTLKVLRNVAIARGRDMGNWGFKSRQRSREIVQEKGFGQDERPYWRRPRSDAWWNLKATRYWSQRISPYWVNVVSKSLNEPKQGAITQNEEDTIEAVQPRKSEKVRQVQAEVLGNPAITPQQFERPWLAEDELQAAAVG